LAVETKAPVPNNTATNIDIARFIVSLLYPFDAPGRAFIRRKRVAMNGWLIEKFQFLLPLAVQWAERQEKRILEKGVPLTIQEAEDARAIGVKHYDRVRLLRVKTVLRPKDKALRAACEAIAFLTPTTRGLTLGHGIFIRADCWRDRDLIAHELVHTAQYERFGGIEAFLRQYLMECLTVGYAVSPLEQEATIV
jgi:hypothetical protein